MRSLKGSLNPERSKGDNGVQEVARRLDGNCRKVLFTEARRGESFRKKSVWSSALEDKDEVIWIV